MIIPIHHPSLQLFGAGGDPSELIRVPFGVSKQVSPNVERLATHTSGLKLRFTTNSSHINIHVGYEQIASHDHQPLTGVAGFDLYEQLSAADPEVLPSWKAEYVAKDGTASRYLHTYRMTLDVYETLSYTGTYENPEPGMHHYTLYLPLYASVRKLELELDDDAVLETHGFSYRNENPWVFYGSSITQGGCATRPGNSYMAHLERRFNLDTRNLGFSGSAKGEPTMATYIASQPMDAFVMDYDHNAPDPEWLQNTHEPFFQEIRRAQPELPIYLLSSVTRPKTEESADNFEARRRIIRQTYLNAKNAGDKNVYYKDMGGTFDFPGGSSATVDGLHPTDFGFYLMAQQLADLIG